MKTRGRGFEFDPNEFLRELRSSYTFFATDPLRALSMHLAQSWSSWELIDAKVQAVMLPEAVTAASGTWNKHPKRPKRPKRRSARWD